MNTDTKLTDTDNFHVDVRVVMEAGEIDFCARPVRVWGWNYRTLQGHLEMGQMDNPLIRVGFALFGRRMQKKFARRALARMHALVLDQVGGRRDQPTGDLPEPTLESVVVERAASDIRLNQAFHRHR